MKVFNLVSFILFPILRVAGFPFPVPMIYTVFIRKLRFYKDYFYPLLVASIYLFFIILINNITELKLTELAYFVFPIIYLVLIHVFQRLDGIDKIIKIYFYVNLFLVILTGVINYVPYFLEQYYTSYTFGNIVQGDKYILSIYNRSIGLLGHPAWLGLMMYLLGKFLSYKEGKYRYVLMSTVGIVLSGGRAALLTLIILEFVMLIYNKRMSIMKRFRFFIVLTIIAGTLITSMYLFNPNFHNFVNITIEDIKYGNDFRSASIDHRVDRYGLFFDQNMMGLLFGGAVFSDALEAFRQETAVDSELVMRGVQFGLIGYLLLFTPLFILKRRAKKAKERVGYEIALFVLLFAILGSLTTTVMSNMIFMIYISLIIASVENVIAGREKIIIKEKPKKQRKRYKIVW